MHEQHLGHIELRLKLGSLFRFDHNGRMRFCSIQEEMNLLLWAQNEFRKEGLSMVIIAQFSKHSKDFKVYNYFAEIIHLLRDFPRYRTLVKGFDLVGNEGEGSSLFSFKNNIHRLNGMIHRFGLNILFKS